MFRQEIVFFFGQAKFVFLPGENMPPVVMACGLRLIIEKGFKICYNPT